MGKPGGEGQSVFPICPDPPFPGVPTAVAVRKTKGKMMSSVHRDKQTRELSELLESMTQGCLQDKTEHTHNVFRLK